MVCNISHRLFRFLVVFSAVFPFINALVFLRHSANLPLEHSKLIFKDSEQVMAAIILINALLGMSVSIGLYRFKKWSRPAAILTTCVGLLVYCFYSYFVDAGIKVAGDQLSALVVGAVISMAYYSNIAEDFH